MEVGPFISNFKQLLELNIFIQKHLLVNNIFENIDFLTFRGSFAIFKLMLPVIVRMCFITV